MEVAFSGRTGLGGVAESGCKSDGVRGAGHLAEGIEAEKWKVIVGNGVATPDLVGDKLFVFSRQDKDEVALPRRGDGKRDMAGQAAKRRGVRPVRPPVSRVRGVRRRSPTAKS